MPPEKQRLTFISYSRVNKDFALKLAKELKAAGFNIWLDQLDIPAGARWDDALEDALEECKIFMVILTPASISSENVKDEIGYAIDHNKRILPILLENAKIPLRLRRFQYVDFTSKSYEEGVEGAKQLLQNLVDTPTIQTSRSAITEVKQDKGKQAEKAVEAEREQFQAEHKAKQSAAAPAKEPTTKSPESKPSILKNPKLIFGGVGIFILFCVVIFALILGTDWNTPTTPSPAMTEAPLTEAPTQKLEPTQTLVLDTPTPAPPIATPTFAPPVTPFVRIVEITLDTSNNYVVKYETFGYTEVLPGMHIHFFFDTVSQDQAGSPGSGPWKIYGGPSPFAQYGVANRPASATQMCALVANSNHSIQFDSGNCVDLP